VIHHLEYIQGLAHHKRPWIKASSEMHWIKAIGFDKFLAIMAADSPG
jgi:hypothetical protein